MVRQKSFSFNQPTRLLVFSFTLFSTLLFLFFLLPSVFTYAPSSSPGARLRIPPPPSPEAANFTSFFPELPVKKKFDLGAGAISRLDKECFGCSGTSFFGWCHGHWCVEKGPAFTTAGYRDSSENVSVKEAGTVYASGCDASRGSWVWDESYPLYSNRTCSFIDEDFDCQSNGRVTS